MKNKLKEILVKTVIMISLLLMIARLINGIFGLNKEIEWLLFALFFASTLTMVLLQAFIKIEPEVVRAEKYDLNFESYDLVFKFLKERLTDRNYGKVFKSTNNDSVERPKDNITNFGKGISYKMHDGREVATIEYYIDVPQYNDIDLSDFSDEINRPKNM